MVENLVIKSTDKSDKYKELLPQLEALILYETDIIANMANVCAALKNSFEWLWVGFYRVIGKDLVLGPFQGPLACTRIPYGAGVCGSAWQKSKVLIVPDVEEFSGHIACSSLARSEIVLPVFSNSGEIFAVLDIDSEHLAAFDEVDQEYLIKILQILGKLF